MDENDGGVRPRCFRSSADVAGDLLARSGICNRRRDTPNCAAATVVAAAPTKRRRSWLISSDMDPPLLWRLALTHLRLPSPLFGDATTLVTGGGSVQTITSRLLPPLPHRASGMTEIISTNGSVTLNPRKRAATQVLTCLHRVVIEGAFARSVARTSKDLRDDRRSKDRAPHLRPGDDRCIERRSITGASTATRGRPIPKQFHLERFRSLRDKGDQDRRQHHFHQALRERIPTAHGPWISANQPDVASCRAASRR